MSIRAADSFMTDLEKLYDNVVDLDITEQMEEDGKVRDDDLDDLFKLQKSGRYIDIIQKVEDDQNCKGKTVFLEIDENDDSEYNFIVACNALSVDIDTEIVIIHNFIREKYRLKFPELESIVLYPIDYAHVVKKIGNHMDVNFVDLEGLLPSEIIGVVSVSGSTTIGKPLPDAILRKTVEACDRVLALDSAKKKVLQFVENRMGYLAPNLSVVVGSVVAVKLIGAAGGLSSLAKMPSDDVELLGADRKKLPRFPPPDIYDVRPLGRGYINQSGIFKNTPPNFRIQTYQLLAEKLKLAACMDSTREDPTGEYGKSLREEILQIIEDWQKPRPVPVPTESEPCMRKRDGRVGIRPIRRKPTYDFMKLLNNMIFGIPEKPSPRYGMLGQVGSSGADTMPGLTSSSAFTSEQGVKLSNSAKQLADSGTQSTNLSEAGTLSKVN